MDTSLETKLNLSRAHQMSQKAAVLAGEVYEVTMRWGLRLHYINNLKICTVVPSDKIKFSN
jgi:hypothetical protein